MTRTVRLHSSAPPSRKKLDGAFIVHQKMNGPRPMQLVVVSAVRKAAIRSKDTKPEMAVRRGLWSRGFRYRLNDRRLPGHPDLVLRKYRTCIFVNGCFWHGHGLHEVQNVKLKVKNENLAFDFESSACCKIPKTNREFWVKKITRNMERDHEEREQLRAMGWHCITVWECELKPAKREGTLDAIAFTLNRIWLQDHHAVQAYPEIFIFQSSVSL